MFPLFQNLIKKIFDKIEQKNIYILKHRDILVLEFKVYEDKCSIKKIYNAEHLPLLLMNFRKDKNESLKEWLISRIVPSTRSKYEKICHIEEKFKTEVGKIELALMNNALSLSDCYWVDSVKHKTAWSDVNFYNNNFNDYLTEFFLDINDNVDISVQKGSSPSLASSGNLSKAWIINDMSERVLLKYGGNYEFGENYIEKVVSDILDYMEIDHIEYWIENFKNHKYSACKCACSENLELIPMAEYQYMYSDWSKDDYNYILDNFEWNIDFVKMVFIDYVLCNEDRHWYNFGVLRDATTLEVKKLFPIYDNGMCLYCNNGDNIGVMTRSAMAGDINNSLLEILRDERFVKIVKSMIPRMKDAINKYINYSEKLKEHCINLVKQI